MQYPDLGKLMEENEVSKRGIPAAAVMVGVLYEVILEVDLHVFNTFFRMTLPST